MTVPKAAGPGPWALPFGACYLVVVIVHRVGFIGTSGHRGIFRVGPLNVSSALVVLAAGAVPPHARPWLWAVPAAIELVTPFVTVLGESITDVGAATAPQIGGPAG